MVNFFSYVKCMHELISNVLMKKICYFLFFLHNLSVYETYVVSLYAVTYIGHYISTLYITFIRHYISALFNLSFMFIHCHKR